MEQSTLHRRGVGLRGINKAKVSPGYTLFAPLTSPGTVKLINNAGHVVHTWNLPYRPGRHARILANGNLAYNGVHPASPRLFPLWQKYRGGVMQQVDAAGTVLTEHRDPLAHHDAHHLADGSLLYTTLAPLTPAEAARIPGGIPASEAPGGIVYGDRIAHVSASGEELWAWRAVEHLDPALFPLQPHYAREHWPLINSVYPLADGNVLASLRSVSAVIIIARATGKVMWQLDSAIVAQQHAASELRPSGDILLFDNGTFRQGESATYSRVLQVKRATKEIVWQYRDPHPMTFFTPFMGGAQRLKGGNTLVTEAAFGRIFEVTPQGEMVWEYVVPDFASYEGLGAPELEGIFDYPANAVFRAYKYAPEEVPWLKVEGGEQ